MAATLSTDAQILLAIGENASAAQILNTNTDIWGLMVESEMEKEFAGNKGLVANYGSIPSAMQQWLAIVHSTRVAFHAIQHNQNSWGLATTQSKLNVCDAVWKEFLSDLKNNKSGILKDLGLST